jgi:hypothetical protein
MKHLSSIVLAAAVVAAGAVACFKDPTSSLRNGASQILLTRSSVFLNVGDSLSVQAEVKDDQGNTFDVPDAVWTTSDATVAVVNADTSKLIPLKAFSRAFIRTTGAGAAWVYFESQGLKDSVQVYGLPLSFNGTVAHVASPTPRDTITINSTAALTFTPSGADSSVVTIDGQQVWVISRTATAIKVLSPPTAAGATINITNVVLNGVVKMASLDATSTVTVADATEPANDDPATSPTLTLYQDYYGTLNGSDADDFVKFTTTTGDSVRIEIFWQPVGGALADMDGYLLNAAGGGVCALDGCAAAGSSDPETVTIRLTAATTYQIDVNLYDAAAITQPIMYRIRIIKLQ